MKRTCRKEADRSDLLEIIHELDVKTEERCQEREEKRLKMFLDAEEERQKRQYEEE